MCHRPRASQRTGIQGGGTRPRRLLEPSRQAFYLGPPATAERRVEPPAQPRPNRGVVIGYVRVAYQDERARLHVDQRGVCNLHTAPAAERRHQIITAGYRQVARRHTSSSAAGPLTSCKHMSLARTGHAARAPEAAIRRPRQRNLHRLGRRGPGLGASGAASSGHRLIRGTTSMSSQPR